MKRREGWDVRTDLDNRHNWRDHPSQFLIERFIEGRVFHVDSVVNNGKVVAAGVSQYGTTPFEVSHYGGVFTSSTVPYRSSERKQLEMLNRMLLMAFEYESGVSHAEFLQSEEDGEFYPSRSACRVGVLYGRKVLEHACNFNLWREWAKWKTATKENPYRLPNSVRLRRGGLALAKVDDPDTTQYADEAIVYKVKKPKHVGLIFHATKHKRIIELLNEYSGRITEDFLAIVPVKERYDD